MTPIITLVPQKPSVPAGAAAEFPVLLRIAMPARPEGEKPKRSRLNLALVLDGSSSMAGRPFDEVKRSAAKIVRGLRDDDRVSVVVYADRPWVVTPSMLACNRDEICREIEQTRNGGCTNLHGGWLAGAEQLAPHLASDVLSRALLLSDGQANVGVTELEPIAEEVAQLAGKGVSTSTYGLGFRFNEDLMAGIARSGGGMAYYGETAEDLSPNFESELGILAETAGKEVMLTVKCAKAASAVVANDYPKKGDAIALPNLVHGAEVWALIRLKVDGLAEAKSAKLFSVEVAWTDMDGNVQKPLTATLSLPVVSENVFDSAEDKIEVAERAKELEAAAIQLSAKAAARAGNWSAVDQSIAQLRDLAGDNAYVAGVAESLTEFAAERNTVAFSKETTYGAHRMSTRLADVDECHRSLSSSVLIRGMRRARQGKAGQPADEGSSSTS
jgi:Ca-activated chloride channel family protein